MPGRTPGKGQSGKSSGTHNIINVNAHSNLQGFFLSLRQCLGQTLHSLGKIQCFHDFSSCEKNRFAKYFEPVKNSENQYLPHIKNR